MVEAPKPRHEPVQCKRCQQFGHTKTYCTMPFICVKCGGGHESSSSDCKKKPEDKPKCGLCDGEHTANYRGCPYYKRITRTDVKSTTTSAQQPSISTRTSSNVSADRSFAKVADTSKPAPFNERPNILTPNQPPQTNQLSPNRLEAMFEKVLQQNAQILELLTKLITKLI